MSRAVVESSCDRKRPARRRPSQFPGWLGPRSAMLSALLVCTLTAVVSAQSGSGDGDRATTSSIPFARVYLPLEELSKLGADHIPVERQKFEAMVKAASRPSMAGNLSKNLIDAAEYGARFENGVLLDGTAAIRIQIGDEGSAEFSLGDCDLPISRPRWEKSELPAVIGLGPGGRKLGILPESTTGVLLFDWSRRGKKSGNGFLFELNLPPALRSSVSLVLPSTMKVVAPDRFVRVEAESPQSNRWTLQVGSATRVPIVIARQQSGGNESLAIFDQSTDYRIAPQGIDAESKIAIQVIDGAVSDLRFAHDESVRIKSLSVNGSEVTLVSSSYEPKSGGSLARLSKPLLPGNHIARIIFSSNLPGGEKWTIPLVRPSDMIWQKSSATFKLMRPLTLSRFDVMHGRQIRAAAVAEDQSSLRRQFGVEFHREDGAVELGVRTIGTNVHGEAVSSITMGGQATTARVITNLTAKTGYRFELEGTLNQLWSIDSLEVYPEGALEDWEVEPNPNGRSRIQIRLAKPLSVDQPVQLVVNARRPLGPGRDLDYRSLEILRLNEIHSHEEYFAIRCLSSFQLLMSGNEEITPLDPSVIPASMAELVSLNRSDYVFNSSEAADGLAFAYAPGRPQWDGSVQVDAYVHADFVRETYTARCTTDSSAIESVRIRLTPSHPESVRWTLEGFDQELAATRLEVSDDQSETWEVLLPESKDVRVSLVGSRTFEIVADQFPIDLTEARVTNATTQRSRINVHAARELPAGYRVESRFQPLPIPLEAAGRSSDSMGSFLVPDTRADSSSKSGIQLVMGEKSPTHNAWIRSAVTTTSVAEQGTMVHETIWEVENHGKDSLELRLADGCTLRRIMLDGHHLVVGSISEQTARLPLPAGQQRIRLRIESSQQRPRLRAIDRLEVQLPKVDIPQLTQQWQVNLPPRFGAWRQSHRNVPELSLAARIFGWLARTGIRPGISRFQSEVEQDGAAVLDIYDAKSVALIGWMAFLLLIAASAWRSIRSRWLILGAGILGCLLPVIPVPLLAVIRGMAWGALGAVFTRTLPRTDRGQPGIGRQLIQMLMRWGQPTSPAGSWLIAFSLAFSFSLALSFSLVYAQPPATRNVTQLFRVLFPVNKEGEAVGKYVYVPAEMYARLVKVYESQKPVSQRWLITSSLYSGELAPLSNEAPMSIQRVSCTLGLETFRPGLTVALPIPDAESFEDRVQIDGQPADWQWSTNRESVLVRVAQAGSHRIQYSRRLATGSVQAGYGFDCPVMPVPNSRMELSTTRDTRLNVATALGESQTSEESRRSIFVLGPAKVAEVRWRSTEPAGGTNNVVLRQRVWMQVEPGVVRGEVRFARADGESLNSLKIHVSPEFRPVPFAGMPADQTLELFERSLDRHTYLLAQNSENPFLVFPFVILGSTGVGELSLPEIEIDNADTSDNQWAYSVSPGLSYERIVGRATPQIAASAFANGWGLGEEQRIPDFALKVVDAEFPWKMKTYARQSSSLADSRTSVYFSSNTSRLDFSSEVSPIEGDNFKVVLQVPKRMRDAQVTLSQEDAVQPVEWSIDDDGRIHIFPYDAISGSFQVRLTGEISDDVANERIQSVPAVSVESSTVTSQEFNIYRDSTIRLQVLSGDNEMQRQVKPDSLPTEDWQLVESWQGTLDQPASLSVRVTPDGTAVRGRMFILLRQELDGWWADVDYRVEFDNGTPDTIAFSIPTTWGESLSTEPAVLTTIEELTVDRRRLVIRPSLPNGAKQYRLRLSGPIKRAQAVEMPQIIPIRQPSVRRWLGIPMTIRGQRAYWSVSRIKKVKPPREFGVDTSQIATYRLADDADAGARLERVEEAAEAPRVLLQDVGLTLGEVGYAGTVACTVESRGTTHTRLVVPEGMELVSVISQSAIVPVSKIDESTYSVPLGPRRLTQQIKVVFRQSMRNYRSGEPVRVPQFTDAKVESTVWTVTGSSQSKAGLEALNAEAISTTEANRIRIGAALSALNSQSVELASYSREGVQSWFERWCRIARIASSGSNELDSEDELKRIADRLGLKTQVLVQSLDDKSIALGDGMVASCFSMRPGQPLLKLRQSDWNWRERLQRVAVSVAILLLAFLGSLLVGHPAVDLVGFQWIYVVIASFGFVWLLWLRLPWLGFVLIAMAVYYALTAGRWAAPAS